MKVAFILMQFPSPTETFASNDITMLNKLGVDISVFSMKPNHKNHLEMLIDRKLESLNISSSNFKHIFFGVFLMLLNPLKTIDLLGWIIRTEKRSVLELLKCLLLVPSSIAIHQRIVKNNPDIVHLFWGHYPSIVGYLVKRYNKSIKLSTFLGAYDLCLSLDISKFILKRSDFIFTHSFSNILQIVKLGINKDKIEIIHRGVDTNKINEVVSEVKSIKGKIISAGKLTSEKNFDLSIKFLKKLVDRGGNFYLDIVGSGPELSKLKKLTDDLLLNERVKFYSHMTQDRLFTKMAESQFFIMTSSKQSERLPNVIKEAMYCGCVCVSLRTQGLDELITHKVNGFIFDEIDLDLEDFFLHSSGSKLKGISSNAKRTINEQFQLKKSMLKYKEKWERIKC